MVVTCFFTVFKTYFTHLHDTIKYSKFAIMSVLRKPHPNTIKKALLIKELVMQEYEPGNQSKCIAGIWRKTISKTHPMSYRTLMRYLRLAKKVSAHENNSNNQLTLF